MRCVFDVSRFSLGLFLVHAAVVFPAAVTSQDQKSEAVAAQAVKVAQANKNRWLQPFEKYGVAKIELVQETAAEIEKLVMGEAKKLYSLQQIVSQREARKDHPLVAMFYLGCILSDDDFDDIPNFLAGIELRLRSRALDGLEKLQATFPYEKPEAILNAMFNGGTKELATLAHVDISRVELEPQKVASKVDLDPHAVPSIAKWLTATLQHVPIELHLIPCAEYPTTADAKLDASIDALKAVLGGDE